jgi:large subunit ribosomal protein L21
MKKAVIQTGGKQYLVAEGELLSVELVKDLKDGKASFDALLVIDGDKTTVGAPTVSGVSVAAEVVNEDQQDDKVTSIRYKAKKRVHTVRGHRQHKTLLKISKIA